MLVRLAAWGGWSVALTIVLLRQMRVLGQETGLIAVVAIGVSILAGLSISRHKLTDTIAAAMRSSSATATRFRTSSSNWAEPGQRP